MGFATAPATDSIMGSLPPERAGVGSAVNDTTREVGGALGVAIMGSITSAVYRAHVTGDPRFATLSAQAPQVAAAVTDSVASAAVAAATLPADAGQAVRQVANDAYIHGLDRTVVVAAVVSVAGALVALFFLPARPVTAGAAHGSVDDLVVGAAQNLPDPAVGRRDLAGVALRLLADAGMSSLTFNAIATRAGVSTATLEHYWSSRVDGVVEAIGDVAARDPDLAATLRSRLVAPRRGELVARLVQAVDRGQLPTGSDPELLADLLAGPVYHRALITGGPLDADAARHIVEVVLPALTEPAVAVKAAERGASGRPGP